MRDNDCDGAIDEGVQGFYHPDEDGDGAGAYQAFAMCTPAPGYLEVGGDCDDSDSEVLPGAVELCDGIDQDCDSVIDEGARTPWYLDADDDGYGDSSSEVQACVAPLGFVQSNTDCDDQNESISPAAVELCNAADDDCDRFVDEGVTQSSGWTFSLCAVELGSNEGLVPGLDVIAWSEGGPRVFELEVGAGGNDTLQSAEPFSPLGSPVSLFGYLEQSGTDGAAYTGDLDNFRFTSPADGTLSLWVESASNAQVDLLLYDENTDIYEGPLPYGARLEREISEGASYVITLASGGSAPSTYEVRAQITGPDAHRAAYTLWYSGSSFRDGDWINTAVTGDGLAFVSPETPAFAVSDCPELDLSSLSQPSVVIDSGRYHLYFRGAQSTGASWIGKATSPDGIRWTCQPTPVLVPSGADEAGGLSYPSVRIDGAGLWWMWYGRSGSCGAGDCPPSGVSVATSPDGSSWTRTGAKALDASARPSWGGGELQGHQVIRGASEWIMYFSAGSDRSSASIGEARSPDGLSWSIGAAPLLEPDNATQDAARLLSPAAVWPSQADGVKLWYLGEQPLTRFGLATHGGAP